MITNFSSHKPVRVNKWLYGWRIMANYGQGWEYECFETIWTEARARLREYRENCPQYPVKAVKGRETNPEYKGS
jgi:hypothetical protein